MCKTSEEFSARLKTAIGKQAIRSFADAVGVSDRSVRNYLSGESEPTRPVLAKMAEVSGVQIAWLATGEGPMRSLPGPTGPVNVKDVPKEEIKGWLDDWWVSASEDERTWLKVELTRHFPEFKEWLRKRQEGVGEASA